MSKFKKGDRVKFIDEVGEGLVLEIRSNNKLLIEDSHGFDYEIEESKVILVSNQRSEEKAYSKIQPEFKDIVAKNVNPKKLKKVNKDFEEKYKNHDDLSHAKSQNYIEVDLHIHELIDTETGLGASDKLDIQMAHFERMMRRAETKKIDRIVFIHGVGQGVLRFKIRDLLDKYYPNVEYFDANYTEYGYGATEVRFK